MRTRRPGSDSEVAGTSHTLTSLTLTSVTAAGRNEEAARAKTALIIILPEDRGAIRWLAEPLSYVIVFAASQNAIQLCIIL